MKIIFDNYYYFDYTSQDKKIYDARLSNKDADSWRDKWKFNKDHFNKLIAENRYEDAAKYAEQFHFNDIAKNDEHKRNIAKLRREGEQKTALQKSMTPEDFNKYNLGLAVRRGLNINDLMTPNFNAFTPQYNYTNVGTHSHNDPNGTIADNLATYFNRLGSSEDMKRYASSLSITFYPEVQSLLGMDWLMKDNENNVTNFYNRLGMTEEDLRNNGIEVIHEDGDTKNGKTILKFSKSNALAFKLLSALDYSTKIKGDLPSSDADHAPSITGYDDEGNEIKQWSKEYNTHYGTISNNIRHIKEILNESEAAVQKVDTEIKNRSTKGEYAALRVGPLLTNEIYQIQNAYQQGGLTNEEYKYNMEIATQHAYDAVRSMSSAAQPMFTNYKNEEDTDQSLRHIESVDRAKLQEYISYNLEKRPGSVRLQTAVRDGEYGVLLTVDAHEKSEDTDIDLDEKEIQVFLPGFLSDQVQDVFDKDAASRAITEVNSLKDYGYKYTLNDDEVLQANNDGTFTLSRGGNVVVVDQHYAEQKIHESMLLDEAKDAIMEKYTNADGSITDLAGYRKQAKAFAIKAANEIYNDLPDIGVDGSIYNSDKIFNEAKVTDKNTQYEMWKKILSARNIYELLIGELSKYM